MWEPDEWDEVKTQALDNIRKGYELRGFSPDRIRTLMYLAELSVNAQIIELRKDTPIQVPRRQRILSEIR